MLLSRELLDQAERLEEPEQFLALLDNLRTACAETTFETVLPLLEMDGHEEQAMALLYCAAQGWRPEPAVVDRVLQLESTSVLPAAAICLVTSFAGDEGFHHALLLGPDSYKPSRVSSNARYYIVKAMGVSGDGRFIGILSEALRAHAHFHSVRIIVKALDQLGAGPDDEKYRVPLSITVIQGGQGEILISTDEKYNGSSNCIDCRFFPCRINRYYTGGIEDCKFWNRTDPETLGELIDQTTWGDHNTVETVVEGRPEADLLAEARNFLDHGQPLGAIPLLCTILNESDLQSTLLPLVWFDLGRCFSACDEVLLAFISRREAVHTAGLLGLSHRAEQEELASFEHDPEKVFGRPFPARRISRLELRAIGYKEAGLYTQALDCYAEAMISSDEPNAGGWFEMGECQHQLGEYDLAELFMRMGARLTPDTSLREKFLHGAEAARAESRPGLPGLRLDRRREDRAQSDPPNLVR